MYKIKVSYLPRFNGNGTVYRKTYNMPRKVYESFYDVLEIERIQEKDNMKKLWLNNSLERQNNVIFLNLTQAELLTNWLLRLNNVEINKKRAKYDANTCIIINN